MGVLSLLTLGKRTMQGVSQGFPWGSLFLAVWPCEIRPSLMAWGWVYSSVCEGLLQVHWIVYLKLVGTNSRQQATTFRHQISFLERHSKKQCKDIDYLKVAHWLFFTGPVTSWTNLFSWWCSAVWYFLYYWPWWESSGHSHRHLVWTIFSKLHRWRRFQTILIPKGLEWLRGIFMELLELFVLFIWILPLFTSEFVSMKWRVVEGWW